MERKLILLVLLFCLLIPASAGNLPQSGELKLTVYPNPAEDYLKVELNSEYPLVPELQIIDLTGKIIIKFEGKFSQVNTVYRAELDIKGLEAGIYFVKVSQGKTIFTSRLLVR